VTLSSFKVFLTKVCVSIKCSCRGEIVFHAVIQVIFITLLVHAECFFVTISCILCTSVIYQELCAGWLCRLHGSGGRRSLAR